MHLATRVGHNSLTSIKLLIIFINLEFSYGGQRGLNLVMTNLKLFVFEVVDF